MKKDPVGGGTNADGSKSAMYCGYCYVNGTFTRDCTAKEMQAFCKSKLQEMGFPGFLAGLMTKGIPKLERWNK
jgi:Putative zinc ribbon domain